MERVLFVAILLVVLALAPVLVRRWRVGQQSVAGDPALPDELLGPSGRTWVVFTTPMCATCGPVLERIRALEPTATVRQVDAASRPDLATRYRVRSAPTVLRAGADGRIDLRLAGPAAVSSHFGLRTAESGR